MSSEGQFSEGQCRPNVNVAQRTIHAKVGRVKVNVNARVSVM